MEFLDLAENDMDLIDAAREIMSRLYRPGKHHIAAALRTKGGRIYTGVHLEAHAVAVCAEVTVLGKAVSEGETEFDCIVAVRHPRDHEENQEIQIVSPCGTCREILSDYAEDLNVILIEDGEVKKTCITELLPHKYDH